MRARCLFALFALVALAVGPSRADDPKTVELRPKWKRAETVRYEMRKTQVREQDGKEVRNVATRTPVTVEVVSANDDGTVLRWTQGATAFEDSDLDDDPIVKTINTILKGSELDLELDSDGAYTGIRNWKSLRTNGMATRDEVLTQMGRAGTPKAAIELAKHATDKFFATKETVEATFTRQPLLLLMPLGKDYEPGKPIEYEDELPNPFDGDPFPANGVAVLKLDPAKGTARITFKLTPDPKEVTRLVQKFVDEVAKKTGKPASDELPEVKIDDVTEYEVDVNTGWVKSVKATRVITVDKLTQTETVTLTRREK